MDAVGEDDRVADFLDLSLADFLTAVAEPAPAPGAGAVAATVVALAAGLTAMSAGLSRRQLPEANELASRAVALQGQAAPLAQRDADAYAEVLSARRLPAGDPDRPAAVRAALSRAADVPLEIATLGAEVLAVVEQLVRRGNPALRGDAGTAVLLSQAAVRASAALVELNLADEPDDPRREVVASLLARVRAVGIPGTSV